MPYNVQQARTKALDRFIAMLGDELDRADNARPYTYEADRYACLVQHVWQRAVDLRKKQGGRMERKEHAWESLVIADEPERIVSAGCPECGLEIRPGPEAEVLNKMMEHHNGCPTHYPISPKTTDELERLRAENERLREEVEAMAAAVAKFAGDFQGRAETLLESLEGRKDDAGTA